MDWQAIVNEVVKEAMTSKWRDFALTRLPEVAGWTLQKPKAFAPGSEAVYSRSTPGGVRLRVVVDKMNGVWRVESDGVKLEEGITDLDQTSVEFALSEAVAAVDAR